MSQQAAWQENPFMGQPTDSSLLFCDKYLQVERGIRVQTQVVIMLCSVCVGTEKARVIPADAGEWSHFHGIPGGPC